MQSDEIRQRFLEHFAREGHTIVPSASLVPDDPTLLFTNAGMVQFKDVFLGVDTRAYSRATSAQKCMRVSGKHNDLENVGPSPRHHTFFEMLGNFSFGDYFKRQAIALGWAFVVDELGVSPDRLVFTVHRDDDEAFDAWVRDIGVDQGRVLRMTDKTNFWMMADVGPCGPTSEIHYDFGPEYCSCGRADCSVALDNGCDRWLELWNLVFMQYDQLTDGTRADLPRTGVDTGMGLERMAAVMQGVHSNYRTDLFTPILDRVQKEAGHDDLDRVAHRTGYRVLADHGRAMAFLVADGVLPGNDGRNYVLRLIMRRAMRYGRLLGLRSPFLPWLADSVVETMSGPYPELVARADWIREVVAEEEKRFERTIESGMTLLDDILAGLEKAGGRQVPADGVFRLYDTFGFPPDLTLAVAEEHGLTIDRPGFEAAMDEQRARARAAAVFSAGEEADFYRRLSLPETAFVGYDELEATGRVLAIVRDSQSVDQAEADDRVQLVLDRTPFYAESGGQVGDTGTLVGRGGSARVLDTQSPVPGVTAHHAVVDAGGIHVGDELAAAVDRDRRLDITRNHTATHLLHRALERVLGPHAEQRGSLVAPDRLRFDFSHLRAMEPDEVSAVERRVNEMVRSDAEVAWSIVGLEEARAQGAKMLFGEKYKDRVRLVTIDALSRELCGGTHLRRTGQIGLFLVRSESSVGAGLRRIEALTGRGAEAYVRQELGQLDRLSSLLGAQDSARLAERLQELQQRNRDLERALDEARRSDARSQAERLLGSAAAVDGVRVVAARVVASSMADLREQVDAVRDAAGTSVVVLSALIDGGPRVVAAVSDSLLTRGLHAGALVKAVAGIMGGGGGGRPTLAEAGGKDAALLDQAVAAVPGLVAAALAQGKGSRGAGT